MVEFSSQVPDYMKDIFFDAQTSGGLLISVAPEAAERLLDKLKKAGVQDAAIIGEVVAKPRRRTLVE